ncbi:MAG: transcription-repair coupling factor [Tidjanibacter sp.]|nr:transcription-repair coupling factor [Tidjanibacter sp.]
MDKKLETLLARVAGAKSVEALTAALQGGGVTELRALAGSAYALYASATIGRVGGVHIFVSEDRDAAAYLAGDLEALLPSERVLFFPTGYKRSIRFGRADSSGKVQRTAALEALRAEPEGMWVISTYPEALAESVPAPVELSDRSLTLSVGDQVSMDAVEERIEALGFQKVDFVYEPGQYSRRGGIIDVFSFSDNRPVRLDFFGDEIDALRRFEISSQRSTERCDKVTIVPDIKSSEESVERISLAEYARGAAWWIDDVETLCNTVDELRRKMLSDSDEPSEVMNLLTSSRRLLTVLESAAVTVRHPSRRLPSTREITFRTSPQPLFNKQYGMLADELSARQGEGYATYILSESRMQHERLQNVFASEGRLQATFEPMMLTLHEGFIDGELKVCMFTDHQIFDRYHRYRLRGEIDRSQSLSIQELGEMKLGDFVVHIDHGVGRFGGLVRTREGGQESEAVKLLYRDGDVLLVNVHSLHRISRYKPGDTDVPPRVYKLGTGAWQKMKEATKKAVKNIARELIRLYAERKASGGYRFSPDGYLQHEMEASFPYEETPDQQKAMELVKSDMESSQPMDRLICGDVGFGKTEVAIRAAFKAACDSKQVAVLVPTTILALQHYRTFAERLRGMPVRVEMLSRVKSAKEVREIKEGLADGTIDIIIGTHKLLAKDIAFRSLGLLIIDEEQKFGVASKERLRQLSVSVDTLTLTATPIPRTLQFSLMGARDLSVIATPPPNRQPIITESHLFDEEIIREAIEYELGRGGQVFFVHNRVEDIERIGDTIRRVVPEARVVVGHGQMPAAKLEKIIMDFIYGEYDVLLATTIIENGIDIPNANTIIINDAQNFGLSALHQLRGRVGRSFRKSFCYLLSPPDELLSTDARRRLRAIEEFSDLGSGFNIAMQDLDIRGAGNLLGAEQSGFIADMGFETYQKILSEAVAELRAEGTEGLDEVVGSEDEENQILTEDIIYVTDCQVETVEEALLPDAYVGNAAEKLRLYRLIDNMTSDEEVARFAAEVTDRFGQMPRQVLSLLDVVRLRRRCMLLGVEKVKVKNGLMLLSFPADQQSAYYKSALFMGVLRHTTRHPDRYLLRQSSSRLGLTVRGIAGLEEGWKMIDTMLAAARAEATNATK